MKFLITYKDPNKKEGYKLAEQKGRSFTHAISMFSKKHLVRESEIVNIQKIKEF